MLEAPGSYCQPCAASSGEKISSRCNIFAGVSLLHVCMRSSAVRVTSCVFSHYKGGSEVWPRPREGNGGAERIA